MKPRTTQVLRKRLEESLVILNLSDYQSDRPIRGIRKDLNIPSQTEDWRHSK